VVPAGELTALPQIAGFEGPVQGKGKEMGNGGRKRKGKKGKGGKNGTKHPLSK